MYHQFQVCDEYPFILYILLPIPYAHAICSPFQNPNSTNYSSLLCFRCPQLPILHQLSDRSGLEGLLPETDILRGVEIDILLDVETDTLLDAVPCPGDSTSSSPGLSSLTSLIANTKT